MKVLGYDFITKESVRLIRPKHLIIDDVAVVRKNHRSSSIVAKILNSCRHPEVSPSPSFGVSVASPQLDKAQNGGGKTKAESPPAVKQLVFNDVEVRPKLPGGAGLVVQRCVVIAREPDGYGLTVTGDHPVFVQTAKEDGAAYRAGVRQGDRIMKVNGMPVTSANHLEVVRMITGGQTVALTLLGRPPDFAPEATHGQNGAATTSGILPAIASYAGSGGGVQKLPKDQLSKAHLEAVRPLITAPQPVPPAAAKPITEDEKREEWRRKRIHILSQMLDEERRHIEELRKSANADRHLEQAQKRIDNLQSQLEDVESPLATTPNICIEPPTPTVTPAHYRNESIAEARTPSTSSGSEEQQQQPSPTPSAGSKTVRICAPADRSPSTLSARSVKSSGTPVTGRESPSGGMHFIRPQQVDVVPMEEESDDDDAEMAVPLDTQGPFSSLVDLKSRPAHLAVFINYLLCNASPNGLFFYLITDLYQNATGNAKELRKWAYEIFSTFLIPNSPLLVPNIDHPIIESIDRSLSTPGVNETDDLITMKRVFIAARTVAVDDVCDCLKDFQQKRQLGLSSIFDHNLLASVTVGDNVMEKQVAETLLMPGFGRLFAGISEIETLDAKTHAKALALCTIIKYTLNLRPSSSAEEKLLDKCPTFVTKDKSAGKFKIKSMASKRAVQVKGHQFLINPVSVTVYCYQCRMPVWGVNPQAYFCTNCDVVLHRQCSGDLTDTCYPATQKGKGVKPKPRAVLFARDSSEEFIVGSPSTGAQLTEDAADRANKLTSGDSGIGAELGDKPVCRSQSMRTRALAIQPPIPSGPPLHHAKSQRFAPSVSGSSTSESPPSSSGLVGAVTSMLAQATELPKSSSSDFDSFDLEGRPVTPFQRRGAMDATVESASGSSSLSGVGEEEARKMLERVERCTIADGDSDLEVESEIPPLDSIIDWETMRHVKPKEKKRQEVVNELFHTERTHVRNLKVLYRVFYTPLLINQIIPPDLVKLLFANIEDILEIHEAASKAMRKAAQQWQHDPKMNGLYGDIGDLMLNEFDGESGEKLRDATSAFCQHQQYALEVLRNRCKKDENLNKFLAEAESNPLCRKLQLKDMLPVEMQRLVKYPLLLETIAKYTPEPSDDLEKLRKAVELSKSILSAVNLAKRNAENLRRLQELQRRLDTTPFDKESAAIAQDFRFLDLRRFVLVHEGSLTWRFSKGKSVELHVVLLETLLILLTKSGGDGGRLVLKCQEPNRDTRWVPVLPLGPLMTKEKANDKKAFFIVNNSPYGAQIYELVAATATERKTWFKVISDQIEAVNRKGGRFAQSDFTLNDSGLSDTSQGDEGDGGAGAERVHVVTHPRLVNANEIQVEKPRILQHAQPILTAAERLKRDDHIILQALLDKQQILADQLPGTKTNIKEELDKLADALSGLAVDQLKHRDAREVAMSAIIQGSRLLDVINEGMSVKKQSEDGEPLQLENTDANLPSVPCYRLTGIAAPLVNHLKALMTLMQEQQEELKTIRNELNHCKDLAETRSTTASMLSGGSDETLTEITTNKAGSPCLSAHEAQSRRLSGSSVEDESKRKERLQEKRQRNVALHGAADSRTSPEKIGNPSRPPSHPPPHPKPPPMVTVRKPSDATKD